MTPSTITLNRLSLPFYVLFPLGGFVDNSKLRNHFEMFKSFYCFILLALFIVFFFVFRYVSIRFIDWKFISLLDLRGLSLAGKVIIRCGYIITTKRMSVGCLKDQLYKKFYSQIQDYNADKEGVLYGI